jgi:hypothetical protein
MISTLLTIGIPTLAVLLGILLNRNDSNRLDSRITTVAAELRSEIHALRTELHSEIQSLRTELHSEIQSSRTELRGEIIAVGSQSHNDMVMLLRIYGDLESRTTRLEAHP